MKKLWELFITFFKIGLFTFGGGLAMIPHVQHEVVQKKKWITDDEMLDMIAIAESTPGVIAVNTATYVGYRVGKFWGSLVATIGVVIPSVIIICIISVFFNRFSENKVIMAIFNGIRVGVLYLIFNAGLKIYKKTHKTLISYFIILLALVLSITKIFDSIFIILIGASIGIISQIIMPRIKKVEMQDDN
ncbi:MAG TPA: chromate transporter [Acholeplasmataceae bacterium]|jgi:chromate transporter|nr:chromate transporter [Acholeplasmataceae bacterium]